MSQAWIVTRSDHTQRVFLTDITRNISLLRCVKAEINVIPNVTRDLYAEIITCRAAVIQRRRRDAFTYDIRIWKGAYLPEKEERENFYIFL